jgi:hypothetical protein
MTNEDIIRMAREAGFERTKMHNALEQFAYIVAAAEREACAKLCDENTNPNADKYEPVSQYQSGCYITAEYLAEAIRGRGQE